MTITPDAFLALLGSYILVAILGYVLGHIATAMRIREEATWEPRPIGVVDLTAPAAYDWEREGVFW